MNSISAIHPAITESTQNMLVKRAPQRLIFSGLDGRPFQPPPAQMACAGQLNKGPLKRTKAPAIKRGWTPLSQDPLTVESY